MDHATAAPGPISTRPDSLIGSACTALLTTVRHGAANVTSFVRRCRQARADLAPVTRELSELLLVLQLLEDYDGAAGAIPEGLQTHLRPLMNNCVVVVSRIEEVLRRASEGGETRWTTEAREEVGELSKSLSVHRGVMGLVSDVVAILAQPNGHGQEEQMQISEVLEQLRALGSSIVISYSNATLARESFALQVHLGQIVNYTTSLAQTEVWEDVVRTMDEAQKISGTQFDATGEQVRTSRVPAPLRSRSGREPNNSNSDGNGEGGEGFLKLEKFSPLGLTEHNESERPASMVFKPDPSPDLNLTVSSPEPPPSAAPATGFIVMDGFINSDSGHDMAPSSSLFGNFQRSATSLGIPEAETSRPVSHRTFGHRSIGNMNRTLTSPEIPPASPGFSSTQPGTPGLEMAIPMEKEVAPEEEITEEALAFAQVPVHILGRLSVNLVDQVYPNSSPHSGGSDPWGYFKDQPTPRIADGKAGDVDDGASARSGDTGSLHDGNLHFSQVDLSKTTTTGSQINLSKVPTPASQAPTQQSSQASLPTVNSHTPQRPQHVPSNSVASLFRADSIPTSIQTDDSTLPASSRASDDTQASPNSNRLLQPPGQQNVVGVPRGLREMHSKSTMNTHSFMTQKPLPRAPIVYIPGYPGPFIKKKAVVVGNFSAGKTCLIARMAKGHFPRGNLDKCSVMETVRISVDEEPMELALWDIRGIDYDPTWLNNAHVALVCFSVNIGSTDSKGKHLGRWVAEVNRNCPGAAILLVGLKADIRFHARSVEKLRRSGKALVTPEQGEQFRENIGASRYLECSARTGEGVLEVLGETARVAMQIHRGAAENGGSGSGRKRPLSRIGKFFGLSGGGRDGEGG